MELSTGERIQWIIKTLANDSTSEFAKMIGITTQTVSSWIVGNSEPSFKSLVEICNKFMVNPEWILLGTGEPIGGTSLPFIRPIVEMVRLEPGTMGIFMLRFREAVEDVRQMWPGKFGQIIGEK